MSKLCVYGLSIKQIRDYTNRIRNKLGISKDDYINMPKLLDKLFCLFSKYNFKFNYQVVEDSNSIFISNEEAFTVMDTGIIYIKESVMRNACSKKYD